MSVSPDFLTIINIIPKTQRQEKTLIYKIYGLVRKWSDGDKSPVYGTVTMVSWHYQNLV